MPIITLPDGSKKTFEQPVTVADVAASIGAGLAKAAIAGMDFQGAGKTQAMMVFGMAEPVLDALLKANTQEDFEKAVASSPLGMLMPAGSGPPGGLELPKKQDDEKEEK